MIPLDALRDVETVTELLAQGADPNRRNEDGATG